MDNSSKSLFEQVRSLATEQQNSNTKAIDTWSTAEILAAINMEDQKVAYQVEKAIPIISEVADALTEVLRAGGRLLYTGAGTSGRLGVLDAAECPPTFGTDPSQVVGLIAGGKAAMFVAQEGAEDSPSLAISDLESLHFSDKDLLIGLAASGRTPYVLGSLDYARKIGAKCALLTTVPKEQAIERGAEADWIISVPVGPEVVRGSTRMKSGTAQKLVLNMLTTTAMINIGKTYGNVMVDLMPTNKKLIERSKNTIMELTGLDYDEATKLLLKADRHVKTALVMHFASCNSDEAKSAIAKSGGKVKDAVSLISD
ncbi:MAG: N-acetylmuramic acid 6-phosphate etherase [Candidatus Kapaibacteriales bacterium]